MRNLPTSVHKTFGHEGRFVIEKSVHNNSMISLFLNVTTLEISNSAVIQPVLQMSRFF